MISNGRGDARIKSATSFGSSFSAGVPATAATPNPALRLAWRTACDPGSTFCARLREKNSGGYQYGGDKSLHLSVTCVGSKRHGCGSKKLNVKLIYSTCPWCRLRTQGGVIGEKAFMFSFKDRS